MIMRLYLSSETRVEAKHILHLHSPQTKKLLSVLYNDDMNIINFAVRKLKKKKK